MSRIGKIPIQLPEKVEVIKEGKQVTVSGPLGVLTLMLPRQIDIEITDTQIIVRKNSDTKLGQAMFGTLRAILANMVKGVTVGWKKSLEIVGTGYRAEVNAGTLVLTVGFSHPVKIAAPEGITYTVEKNIVTVSGTDKVLVGQKAAEIRLVRPPEPYKGKGIAYVGEQIRRKAGKAAKTAAAA